jgi:hypothetical protein
MKKILIAATLLATTCSAQATNLFDQIDEAEKLEIAFAAAMSVHYERCGGKISKPRRPGDHPLRSQEETAISTALYELGSSVATQSRVIAAELTCQDIKHLYETTGLRISMWPGLPSDRILSYRWYHNPDQYAPERRRVCAEEDNPYNEYCRGWR